MLSVYALLEIVEFDSSGSEIKRKFLRSTGSNDKNQKNITL